MNDDLLATLIIRQCISSGSSVRVLSSNTPFPLLDSSTILLKLAFSEDIFLRRYDMCLSAGLLTALCNACLKLNERQVITGKALAI